MSKLRIGNRVTCDAYQNVGKITYIGQDEKQIIVDWYDGPPFGNAVIEQPDNIRLVASIFIHEFFLKKDLL